MMEDVDCKLLCTTDAIPKEDAEFITERVKENYAINWLIDGLPAARKRKDERAEGDDKEFYGIGFELGYAEMGYVNTHYSIEIRYHAREDDNYRVVGVLVTPNSSNAKEVNGEVSCAPSGAHQFNFDGKDTITYTYSVTWTVRINLLLVYHTRFSFSHFAFLS
jgi:transmembrane 9 superfamily protein 2/4